MNNFDAVYKKILQNYKKRNIREEIMELGKGKNIPKLIEHYNQEKNANIKKLILNIIYHIKWAHLPVRRKYKDALKSFLLKELSVYDEIYSNKIELVEKFELKGLGKELLTILKTMGGKLKVYELDTLIFTLGFFRYFPAQKYIKLYVNSKHKSVKYCAEKALKYLKKKK